MNKYATDLTTNDVLLVGERNVIVDWLDYDQESDLITILGYFEDDGAAFHAQVYGDKYYKINTHHRPLVG